MKNFYCHIVLVYFPAVKIKISALRVNNQTRLLFSIFNKRKRICDVEIKKKKKIYFTG